MLTENDVVEAVCIKLEYMGFEIKQRLHTKQRGIDIIAYKDGYTLMIEAKGETSSDKSSNRFGQPFSQSQIKNHVGKTLLAAFKLMSKYHDSARYGVGIALPDNSGHRKEVEQVRYVLKKLGLFIFWVNRSFEVEIEH